MGFSLARPGLLAGLNALTGSIAYQRNSYRRVERRILNALAKATNIDIEVLTNDVVTSVRAKKAPTAAVRRLSGTTMVVELTAANGHKDDLMNVQSLQQEIALCNYQNTTYSS